jgi:hypothetical protein
LAARDLERWIRINVRGDLMAGEIPVIWTKCGSDVEFTSPEIGNPLTKGATPIYDIGKFGNGVKGDGVGDFWTFNPIDYFSDMYLGSVELWFERNSGIVADSYLFVIYSNIASQPLFGFYTTTNNTKLRFILNKRPATNYLIYDQDITGLADNTMHHVALMWDNSHPTKKQRAFLNGEEIASANVAMTGLVVPNGQWGTIINQTPFPANYSRLIVDNVKMYNVAKIDYSDRFVEGFRNVISSQKVAPRVIFLNDKDVYALGHIKQLPNISEQKTFQRERAINNSYILNVDNADNFYSINNPVSYFNNVVWRYGSCKIYNQYNDLIWDGIIRKIKRNPNNSTASVETVNALHKKFNTKITYTSTAFETVADVAKSIMDSEGIEYDSKTMQNSINQLSSNSKVKVSFNAQDQITVMQALEKLAEFGCADLYSHLNKMYFKHWQAFTGGVKVTLQESDIENFSRVDDTESEIINQYRIGYAGDLEIPATDDLNNDIGQSSRDRYGVHDLPEMDSSGSDSQIWFENNASAVYVGECYIKRSHIGIDNPNQVNRPPEKITFEVSGSHREWIDLESYFQLNESSEKWVNKIFEVFAFINNLNDNKIKITAYEVDNGSS